MPWGLLGCVGTNLLITIFTYDSFWQVHTAASPATQANAFVLLLGCKTSALNLRLLLLQCHYYTASAWSDDRRAQPFRHCRPDYVYFYELQPAGSSRYFNFLHCFYSAFTHYQRRDGP